MHKTSKCAVFCAISEETESASQTSSSSRARHFGGFGHAVVVVVESKRWIRGRVSSDEPDVSRLLVFPLTVVFRADPFFLASQ